MDNILAIAEALERDRREPDKVLLYVADLRRIADQFIEIRKQEFEIVADAATRYGDIMAESSGENELDPDHSAREHGFTTYTAQWDVLDGKIVAQGPEGWLDAVDRIIKEHSNG